VSNHGSSFTESWRAGREAVARFALFCSERGWNFVEVPQQSDFGKDGYVEAPDAAGNLIGDCFAVQIKGGRSRWHQGGYRIDATEQQRSRWAFSTMPVIGIAIDPADNGIYWTDLSATLRQNDADVSLLVRRDNRLDTDEGLRHFRRYCSSMTQSGHAILDLVSPDPDRQADAAFLCYHVGREDGRALVLLRRMLCNLHEEAFPYAVHQLAGAIPHPDMVHTSETMVSAEARRTLRESLDWSPTEVRRLLSLVDAESGFDRGSMGQTVFHLLTEGALYLAAIREATIDAARAGDEDVANWGLVLITYLAEDNASDILDEILRAEPRLAEGWAAGHLAEQLRTSGSIELW
jgi:hypothetical protein